MLKNLTIGTTPQALDAPRLEIFRGLGEDASSTFINFRIIESIHNCCVHQDVLWRLTAHVNFMVKLVSGQHKHNDAYLDNLILHVFSLLELVLNVRIFIVLKRVMYKHVRVKCLLKVNFYFILH